MFLYRPLKVLLIVLISLIVVDTLDAQRRTRSRTRDDSRTSRTRDRDEVSTNGLTPWYAISLGTLGFGGGFSISGKFAYGVKFQDRVSIGAYGKGFYDLVNFIGAPDQGLLSYGGGAFTRVNITQDIFIHGEYSYTSFEQLNQNPRLNKLYPSVGGGYKAGYGDWTYGFHVLLPLDEQVRNNLNLEYWIDFNFRF